MRNPKTPKPAARTQADNLCTPGRKFPLPKKTLLGHLPTFIQGNNLDKLLHSLRPLVIIADAVFKEQQLALDRQLAQNDDNVDLVEQRARAF